MKNNYHENAGNEAQGSRSGTSHCSNLNKKKIAVNTTETLWLN